MRPGEIKLRLEMLSMSLNVVVTGLHSVHLIEDDRVDLIDCLFDIQDVPGSQSRMLECDEITDGRVIDTGLLHFRVPRPALVDRSDINAFALWLASPPDEPITVH